MPKIKSDLRKFLLVLIVTHKLVNDIELFLMELNEISRLTLWINHFHGMKSWKNVQQFLNNLEEACPRIPTDTV